MRPRDKHASCGSSVHTGARLPTCTACSAAAAIDDRQWRRLQDGRLHDNEAVEDMVEYENAIDEAAAIAEAMETSGDDALLRVEA